MQLKTLLRLCLCLILSVVISRVNGQASQTNYFLPSFYPKAPNTASLEKFGSYDVNLFTGLPNISIPLYTVEAGGLKVPITLSYHASGIRVPEIASWAGLGWSVSTGGNINRKIVGKADEAEAGYLYNPARTAASFNNSDLSIDSLMNIVSGYTDTRPDIFSYDFPGHGGKFFFDGTNNYVPALVPFAPVKISYSSGLTKFNMTDEHGNNYTFGDGYVETTYSGSSSHWPTPAVTSWQLKKAVSQNRRDTVNFTYTEQQITSPDVSSNTDIVDDNIVNGGTTVYTYGWKQGQQSISSSYVMEKLPEHIYFKNGRVDFETETTAREDQPTANNARALKNIKVYQYDYASRTMQLQKTIRFFHSYFNAGQGQFTERLKLDSIQVQDKSGASVQHYGFTYNTATALPAYSSLARDYWGFYNGKDNDGINANNSLTPQMWVLTTHSGVLDSIKIGSNVANNRITDSVKMQAFALTSIKFPTGGHTDFTYQANRYYKAGNLTLAGGLRVQSISSYDNISGTPIVKTYQYNDNLARANFILDNVFFANFQTRQYWTDQGGSNPTTSVTSSCNERTFVSNPRIDLEPFDAATVVYPQVSEYTGTPGANIGRTDYLFRDKSDNEDISSMTGTPVITSYFYARGQLIKKSEYLRKADGSYQVAKVDSNSYTAFAERRYAHVGLGVGKNISNEGSHPVLYGSQFASPISQNGLIIHSYDILSDDNYLTGTQTSTYDLADPTKVVTSTVAYNFGTDTTHQQIISTTHTDSKGNIRTTINKYAFNYPAGNSVIDSMVNRRMWTDAIEKSESYSISGTAKTTSAQLTQYVSSYNNAIVPSAINVLNIISPVTNFTASGVSAGALTKDSRYTQMISFNVYDGNNNLLQYTPRNSQPISVGWDYLGEKPIAQVKNAAITDFRYTSFEADGTGNFSYSGPTVTDPTAPTGSRVYNLSGGNVSGGLNSARAYVLSLWSNNGAPTVTAGSGITGANLRSTGGWTYYEYNIPSGNSTVSISGTMAIDELRLYPVDAQMTTYAYNTDGITDLADTKGGINHFDYDAFGRLRNAKDWIGNIVKNYGYHTYDQLHGNVAQGPTSYTRNNCPAGTTPGSTTYSVAANKYYAVTTADANAEAAYDMNVNGQIKANTACGCPITMVSYTLTNNTGHAGYQATFSGIGTPYNFPTSGTTVVSVPAGTYATVSINPVGTFTATFTMGTRTPQTGHSAGFSSVVVATGSSDLSLTIN